VTEKSIIITIFVVVVFLVLGYLSYIKPKQEAQENRLNSETESQIAIYNELTVIENVLKDKSLSVSELTKKVNDSFVVLDANNSDGSYDQIIQDTKSYVHSEIQKK
jgi:uncharacterized membrane protein affecting hemolysin expression